MGYIEVEEQEEVDAPDEIGLEVWQEYARRKQAIENIGLTASEYFDRVQEIAKELGI